MLCSGYEGSPLSVAYAVGPEDLVYPYMYNVITFIYIISFIMMIYHTIEFRLRSLISHESAKYHQ